MSVPRRNRKNRSGLLKVGVEGDNDVLFFLLLRKKKKWFSNVRSMDGYQYQEPTFAGASGPDPVIPSMRRIDSFIRTETDP